MTNDAPKGGDMSADSSKTIRRVRTSPRRPMNHKTARRLKQAGFALVMAAVTSVVLWYASAKPG